MATVTKKSLEALFQNIDSKLEHPIDIYIIGGASAILGYNIVKQTDDVDLDGSADTYFHELFRKATEETGTDLVLSSKGVFTPPEGYRERMHFTDFPNRKLRIWSYRVGGANAPSSHTTVRTVPYTAVQYKCVKLLN
ncbi:MAG: DUF6036 family nucleotidyltransferase [Pseudobdellovibrionaceae bacterium]